MLIELVDSDKQKLLFITQSRLELYLVGKVTLQFTDLFNVST